MMPNAPGVPVGPIPPAQPVPLPGQGLNPAQPAPAQSAIVRMADGRVLPAGQLGNGQRVQNPQANHLQNDWNQSVAQLNAELKGVRDAMADLLREIRALIQDYNLHTQLTQVSDAVDASLNAVGEAFRSTDRVGQAMSVVDTTGWPPQAVQTYEDCMSTFRQRLAHARAPLPGNAPVPVHRAPNQAQQPALGQPPAVPPQVAQQGQPPVVPPQVAQQGQPPAVPPQVAQQAQPPAVPPQVAQQAQPPAVPPQVAQQAQPPAVPPQVAQQGQPPAVPPQVAQQAQPPAVPPQVAQQGQPPVQNGGHPPDEAEESDSIV